MIAPAGRATLAITVAMTLLATIFVSLRFLARRTTSVPWDDCMRVASLVVAYSFVAVTVLMVTRGHAGHNIGWYDPPTIIVFVQSYLATDILATALIFPSTPVEAEWKPWIPHTAIDKKAFWVSFCAINLALDIAVLCLPQPIVWGLKMTQQRKVQLSLVFLLGAFVCVASIIRIWVLVQLDMDNLTYSLLAVAN